MQDAAYAAYVQYAGWLRRPATLLDQVYWWLLRLYAQGNAEPTTEDYLVPWILAHVSRLHHLRTTMEYRIYNADHHLSASKARSMQPYSDRQAEIIKQTDYGQNVHRITLAPAIYLSMTDYPEFAVQVPSRGLLTAAIQLHHR